MLKGVSRVAQSIEELGDSCCLEVSGCFWSLIPSCFLAAEFVCCSLALSVLCNVYKGFNVFFGGGSRMQVIKKLKYEV